jgi:hypothetical protein
VPIWAAEGYPADVDWALRQLADLKLPKDLVPVIAARTLSSGSIERLDKAGLSWVDETGRTRIAAPPGLLLVRDVGTAPPARTPDLRWSPSLGAVAEFLLMVTADDPRGRSASGSHATLAPAHQKIAETTQVSAPQVSKVLGRFDEQGWTTKRGTERGPGASRVIVDPAGLLGSWAAWHVTRLTSPIRAHAVFQDPRQFATDKLAPALSPGTWCVTGWLAADLLAPFTTSVPTITCYVNPNVIDTGLPAAFAHAGLRPVESGSRVDFRPAEPHLLVMAEPNATLHLPIASPVRVYADLLALGARGEDAANHLREVRLGY